MSTFLLSYVHNGCVSAATIDAADFDDAEARLASLLQGATILGIAYVEDDLPADVARWAPRTAPTIKTTTLASVDLMSSPWAFLLFVVVISAALLALFFYPSNAG